MNSPVWRHPLITHSKEPLSSPLTTFTSETLQAKTSQVMFRLETDLLQVGCKTRSKGAHKVLASLSSQNTAEGLDELVSRWTLVRRQLLLAGAVDRCTAEYLMTQREEGRLAEC